MRQLSIDVPVSVGGLKPLCGKIDWNIVMRTINGRFDQLDKVTATLNCFERRQAFDTILRQLRRFETDVYREMTSPESLQAATVDHVRLSELMGNILLLFSFDPNRQRHPRDLEDRWTTELQLIQTAVGLQRYRINNNELPKELDALKPDFLTEVPVDRFSDQQLVYRPTEDGYVLYSVGSNCTDNGSSSYDTFPFGDDRVLRMTIREQSTGNRVIRETRTYVMRLNPEADLTRRENQTPRKHPDTPRTAMPVNRQSLELSVLLPFTFRSAGFKLVE